MAPPDSDQLNGTLLPQTDFSHGHAPTLLSSPSLRTTSRLLGKRQRGRSNSSRSSHTQSSIQSQIAPRFTGTQSFTDADIADILQGRIAVQGMSSAGWDPSALLDPRKYNKASASKSSSSPHAAPVPNLQTSQRQISASSQQPANPSTYNDNMIFEFSGASGGATSRSDVSEPPSTRSRAASPAPDGQEYGVGNFIERMSGVQDRSAVPQVKRRKVDTPEAEVEQKKIPSRVGGSGTLGSYVKEKHEEGKRDASAQATSQTVDLTLGDDDDSSSSKPPQEPGMQEVCFGMAKGFLHCNMVPSPKPTARSIYGPGWSPAVKIVLKRISGDKTLQVQAYDCTREIIGFVDTQVAEALVPVLDANIRLRTDCQIPPRKTLPGEQPGKPTSQRYPINVILYAPRKYAKSVGKHFKDKNVALHHPNRVDKGVEYVNLSSVTAQDRAGGKNRVATQNGQSSSYTAGSNVTPRTVEEIKADVMGVFDAMGKTDDLPEKEASPLILTPLLKHQKQALHFMCSKEAIASVEERTEGTFYKLRVGASGQRVFYNVITGFSERQLPTQTRGGILADMMGLGKTLSILSLICYSLPDATAWAETPPTQPEAPPQKQGVTSSNGNSLGLTRISRNTKSTLLVCPLSTATNWEEQIKQHIAPGQLSYYIYHGSNRIKDIDRLAEYDLVITTYGSISSELGARSKRKSGRFPLEEIGWFRIVLDEAHMIREVSTLQFKAIVRLQASRRWAVTGTPVQNRLEDLAALLQFLRLKPFDDRNKFNRFIVDPFKACDTEIVPKLRVLVDCITLRRLKDKIDLPPRTDHVIKLDFTPEERQVYDLFEKNAQDRVKVLAGESGNQSLRGHTYMHILRSILRLRLLCAHGKDLLNQEDLDALQGMTADLAIDLDSDDEDGARPALSDRQAYEMFELMQETNADNCSRCSKKLGTNDSDSIESEKEEDLLGYMTPCFHVICGGCIRPVKEQAKAQPGKCPFCPQQIKFEYIELRRTRANAEHDGQARGKDKKPAVKLGKGNFDKYEGPHTKTKALVEDLMKQEAASAANPDESPFKSVVFSGWTSHLDLIQLALDAAGISYTRLDGRMARIARTNAMDKFREDPAVHVILVSITAGGLGLNLTAGNNVYVMEPQYNPAAEAQAIDRVHRLGQKRPVRTVRYIMSNSFEEKMVDLQEKKKQLASLSMDQKDKALDKGDAARQKLMDLRILFK